MIIVGEGILRLCFSFFFANRYKTLRNYKTGDFLGPRIGDKILMGLIVMTLFLNVGNNYAPSVRLATLRPQDTDLRLC